MRVTQQIQGSSAAVNIATRRPIPTLMLRMTSYSSITSLSSRKIRGWAKERTATGTDIRGNLQLGYTITIDHGSLSWRFD